MLPNRKNILIICLSLVVAFAPLPALIANAAINTKMPCRMTMDMDMMHTKGHIADNGSTLKSASPEHCQNCDEGNSTCQQCNCSLTGCTFSKVHYSFAAAVFPRFSVAHHAENYFTSYPPHSRLTPPLLRPPIQLRT